MTGLEGMTQICQVCRNLIPEKNLRWHILREHCISKIMNCSICGEKVVSETALQNHIEKVHMDILSICPMCNKQFKNLELHINAVHIENTNLACILCDFKAVSKDGIDKHMKTNHKDFKPKTFRQCPHCEKTVKRTSLARHINMVHNNENFACPYCGNTYNLSSLK